MSLRTHFLACCACAALLPVSGAVAASVKTYQVTGPVVAVSPTSITVEKNGERWEIARDASAEAEPVVKAGDRVTVHYRMTATRIEAKPGKSGDAKEGDATTASKKKAKSE